MTARHWLARGPLRWLWRLGAFVALRRVAGSPPGHIRSDWRYTAGLAEMLDEPGEDYITPADAVIVDRDHWEYVP